MSKGIISFISKIVKKRKIEKLKKKLTPSKKYTLENISLDNAQNNVCPLTKTDVKFFQLTVLRMKSLFLKFRNETTSFRYNLLMSMIKDFEELVIKKDFGKICKDKNFAICRVLAALALRRGSVSARPAVPWRRKQTGQAIVL